ncbi:hypothetical protein S40293_07999 [Stachybotrys chartarum IBT 40293]|nr:hypothetical protein S40293_07999 [Stachybotrys chartarum IBT 40293]
MALSLSDARKASEAVSPSADIEPCILPAFDVGENDSQEFLSIRGRLAVDEEGDATSLDPRHVHSVLRSAWGVLLNSYTGLERVCFGLQTSTPHQSNNASQTINSNHNALVAQQVMNVAQLHIAGHKHLHALLSENHLGPTFSSKNGTKLFDTVLSIRGCASETRQDSGMDCSTQLNSVSNPWCKIHLVIDPVSFETNLSWMGTFMTRRQAMDMASTYEKIVSEILARAHVTLADLSFFSERNEQQVLAWNSNPINNVQKCIHHAISEQAALRPSAEAVCAWDGSFSYAELEATADQLAHRLEASGVGPEVFVPICFDKSKWTIVAILAVLKAGAVFVPLDPTHPVPRLQALAHKVEAKTLLCSRQHRGMLETVATELIPVDAQLFAELPTHNGGVERGAPSNGAYMIFTSGTTGEPKGALIEHGALMSSALAHGPAMLMDSNTRSLQFAASTFDVSITEILTCLILGGCVCVPSEEARLNNIEGAITELRANWALLTPTFVKFINPANVPCLKTLVTGGEAMTQAIIRSWSHINLINCYGPAETSVVSHVHPFMKEGKNPLNIGRQVGIHCWVVDRYDHNRLMPVGAVGELVIEGHTLARGYYKEPDKTNDAFIFDPAWALRQNHRPGPRRMYKTGDLVKYNSDGTFHIAGRKDTQIKFHGQRIELGEIEHSLNISPSIKHGMVVLPKEGFCQGRLLTIVQLSDSLNRDLVPNGQPYKLVDGRLEETAKEKLSEVKQFLTERLPPYMIPSMWLAVEFIPRLQSGKLDRKQTARWIDCMSEELFRQLNPVTATASSDDMTFASQTELDLHEVWSHVLNLKKEQLGLRQSFLSVGGDSISAMQIMSECKKRGIGLTVRDIISCKSISELACHVKAIETPLCHQEILEQPFDLSPIQSLYFSRPNHAQGHYNQSFLLKTSQRILASDMEEAIVTVIQRHSMLRARFSQTSEGTWQQRITNDVASSYRLRTVKLVSRADVDASLADSQTCLNETNGPLFAADLIDVNGEEELLFVVAHHLVIDLVSWRVILQDLEDLLLRPDQICNAETPLPFQTWCRMQAEHCRNQTPSHVLPVQGIPDGNAEYWGMETGQNNYGLMAHKSFEIGSCLTSLLLAECHRALRTEIPDVLLAVMIYSFGQIFTDRPTPPVFAEGHGREPWDSSIDLSNVVGWFTTIYPVYAGSAVPQSLTEIVKFVKDARRKVPDKGRSYFASRWLTDQGRDAFARHWPLEITFNYLGQYQQLEREGALFTPVRDIAGEVRGATQGADVGPLTTCISFFEVSAVILKGCLRFSFVFNQNMKHQAKIHQWIDACEQNLGTMIEELCVKTPEHTLSDFELLSLTYDRLQLMTTEKLPQAGVVSVDLVEDAYPCSPLQSGLLVSTAKNRSFYAAYTLHEVKSRSDGPVDAARLADAWRRMVEYHPILRSIFIESVSQQDSLFDQVVLKQFKIPLTQLHKETDAEAIAALSLPPLHQQDNAQLLHHFEICTTRSGKVFCRLDISHVIMDGTSMSILFRDLAAAYDNALPPGEGPLYRNYIKYLAEQPLEAGIKYWSSYLAGVEPCHFPVLNGGDAVEAKELRYVRLTFEELTDLQTLCDDRGVTIVNAIYTAWALTLRLYTASDDVTFGYLTSARDAPIEGVRDVVGPVINMVACRVNMTTATTLGDIMVGIQKDYLDSLAYRHIPLAEVQHALQLSGTALFNTALSYRKLPAPTENETGIMFEECRPTYDPDEYNVSVNIEAGDSDMAIDLMYWTDTLSEGQAKNVASTFTKALSNILHQSDRPLAGLENLGDWHLEQLRQWNKRIPEGAESCIHEEFHKRALLHPDAPAIASWDMNFTYKELDSASTSLAHHIMSLGVGLEVCVLVCFEKSAFAVVAMLAILKAGGICVPLDPTHPDAALRLRADDTAAKIALVSPQVGHRLEGLVDKIVPVDSDILERLSISSSSSLAQVSPQNACFIIYTSGSTGRPKGVVLEHRGIVTNCVESGPRLGYVQARVLQFASYTFDNSLAEIFTTLTHGSCICVPSAHERLNDLAGVINRLQVTMADVTPTVATFLQPAEVPSLKTLALGGEAVTTKCVEIWRDSVTLQCCYGPSECSVNSTYSGDIAKPGKATNIGRAIGCVAWVVHPDDHHCLLPIGCVGELLIDGPIVSRGYLNLPEKTRQSFVNPPEWAKGILLGGAADRRLYKTGDLVRYEPDGSLMYLGRKDTQVKLNGQRIELGEIEHHIEQSLSEDDQAAVELIVVGGKKSLACFICTEFNSCVPASGDESSILPMYDTFKTRAKELEVLLSEKVPAYMVPTMWLPISKMPLTSSGKLDRRSLRLQAQSLPTTLTVSYKLATKCGRAPSTEAEKDLARMWASVLSVDDASIGVDDTFFKLGGDSIGAMKLVTLARTADINLTVASIFQKSSLRDMAQAATPMSKLSTVPIQPFSLVPNIPNFGTLKREIADSCHIRHHLVQDIYPCTAVQEGLMALSNREPGAYVAQFVYLLPERMSLERFRKAWDMVVESEAILRTRIVHTEVSGFLQVVVDEGIEWSSIPDLSHVRDSERKIPSHNGGKLTSFTLVGDGSSSTYFVWTIHHALYDGWCLPLLLDKVKECYESVPITGLISGPPYAGFIKYLEGLDSKQTDQFWQSRLSNVSAEQFPRLPNPDYQACASNMIIHKASFNREPGSEITAATKIRAAWALTVSAYSAANDVVFWETLTGRDAPVPDIENMGGPTLATIPMRVEAAETMAHQFAGIQRIRRLNADTAIACDAQNLIAINNGPREASGSFWNEQNNEMAGTNFYTYPLMLSCHIDGQELETVVHFDQRLIPEWKMRRVMDQFEFMLSSVNSEQLKNERLGDLALLSTADRASLQVWNSTLPAPVHRQIHELIEDQATTQDETKHAVCAWDCNLTYNELLSLSDRLASFLTHNGIGHGSVVPLCLEKSSLVVVSMMAVLKSGAAFVPLDPAHPDSRISGILADVDATVLLCSPKYAERCARFDSRMVSVSREFIDDIASTEIASTSTPGSVAYMIFTSGTTGKPKGTIVQHCAFCAGAIAHGARMGMTKSSRVLQFASYTFDASIMEVLTTLINGGTVCVPSDEERINDLSGTISRMKINWALLTPSVAQLIHPPLVPDLKTLVLGGEAMSSVHISAWSNSTVQLMNAYGPSETAVVAAVNPQVTLASGPSNIGYATGGLCWVTDPENHNRLAPIGAVGELVVEGPILAQGYLKNEQKTSESFVVDPAWTTQFPHRDVVSQRRFYKTGDLVKLDHDGSILFQGRKDSQVKLRGQRLELSEVEHHLVSDPTVQYALAAVPSSGPCAKQLIAVISPKLLADPKQKQPKDEILLLKTHAAMSYAGVQERLERHLPPYMIPTKWAVIEQFPLLPSGKLDRRKVLTWIENMSDDVYDSISDAEASATKLNREASVLEERLRALWAKVLGLELEKVPFTRSFLQLGGDSISAMQLMAVCRSSSIAVTVPQIIKSKSLVELATRATEVEEVFYEAEEEDQPFDLSPIQKLYFESMNTGSTHFNQTILLCTSRNIGLRELTKALECIIDTHSMLRARFSMLSGAWKQHITADISGSYRLRAHTGVNQRQLSNFIDESQHSLNIVNGPLFVADVFKMENTGEQIVAFVAHHLVIDVVSWHIILQDLEVLLASDSSNISRPFSFQKWNSLQLDQARNAAKSDIFHDFPMPSTNLSYWGMQDIPNIHGDALTEDFEVDTHHSLLLLGSCHEAFQTDTADILLASLLDSFRQAFPDRPNAPSIFNEGHGREPWDENLDLSRTVGWFTTLCPIYLPDSLPAETDILDIVKWVKDFRRKVPGKGRPYFAHRLLSHHPSEKQSEDWPAEIAFNYLGQTQQLEREDSIFRSLDGRLASSVNDLSDIGKTVPRLSLIEISAAIRGGNLKFSFSFNRHMKLQNSIRKWMTLCRDSIHRIVEKLSQASNEPTMADFPLLPLAFDGISQLKQKLPQLGVASLNDLEAVYPCSPVQQGILFTQIKDPKYYSYSVTFEVKSESLSGAAHVQRLMDAWQAVVQRHSTLRTIFVDSLWQEGKMDQIVLKSFLGKLLCVECSQEELPLILSQQSFVPLPEDQPPHRMRVISTSSGKVICILEMSHAIADGTSMPILFRDLALAYEGTLPSTSLACYQDYISYLQQAPSSQSTEYWKNYLVGAEPCYFPNRNDGLAGPRVLRALDQTLAYAAELQAFCTAQGVTLSNVLQLVWALVLQAYTGLDDVCFGYLVAGRDVPVRDIDEAVGVYINMLICRVQLNPATAALSMLQSVQADLMEGMLHKHVSLAEIQHETSSTNTPLFNTAYSFQRRSVSKSMANGPLSFEISDAQDPSEYDITVNVEVWDATAELQLCYWADKISDLQAKNIASTFDRILSSLVTCNPGTPIGELEILSIDGSQKLLRWNNDEPQSLEDCVHRTFELNVKQQSSDTPAVDGWDGRFTYEELNLLATRLAEHLIHLGVKQESFVPLCFEKSAWTVVAMMAVLKAGAAFVPLDPAHPPERIAFLLQSVDAKLVLCSPSLQSRFENSEIKAHSICKDSISSLPATTSLLSQVNMSPRSPAYIIFTSGTTGLPKGTIIEHGAFVTGAIAHAKAINMTSTSRVLQFASHTFDASIMEILSTLLVGGCVCIPSDQDRLNDLAAVISRFKVNWTLLTPSVANVLKPGVVPSLKTLVTGGEAMSRDHITKWINEASLINAYGPSETSVIAATSTKVDVNGTVLNRDPACIGHAVGSRCWVVDPRNHNRLMPIGGIGELVVEGPIVARGYLNNDAKTRDAFIEHPVWRNKLRLAGLRKDRMYKTGDLVAYNSDGSLNYVARKDTQIKLNGQRIELGEIEHHVKLNLPSDVQSAVDLVVPQSKTSTKSLAVFFTSHLDAAVDNTDKMGVTTLDDILLPMSPHRMTLGNSLKSALKETLPTYMLPTIYLPITKMPWTSSGKLDRQRLKAIVERIPLQHLVPYKLTGTVQKHKPVTAMQLKLRELWQKILHLGPAEISTDDSFFRLGGDSVAAMKLVAAARTERIALTVLNVFRHPKLSDMAVSSRNLGDTSTTTVKPLSLLGDISSPDTLLSELADRCGVQASHIQDAYPCSSLQEGLVTLSLQQPGAYVAENVFTLPHTIDLARFKSAWEKTVNEVDILRSRIVTSEALKSYVVVLQPQPIDWRLADSLEAAADYTSTIPGRNGGDLAQWTIVQEEDSSTSYFVWTVHHALYDAWSMPNMLKLVETHYSQHDQPAPLPSLPFANFIKYLENVNIPASNEFWRARLEGASASHFPPVLASSADAADSATLQHTILYNSESLDMDITIPTVVRAAWALILGSQTCSDHVAFGETLSGRDIALHGVGDILGPTLSTVPSKVQIDRDMTVTRFLQSLHEKAVEMIPYQHAGLQNIKRLGKAMTAACEFNNLLVIQSSETSTPQNLLMQPVESDAGQKNFFTYPLVVECSMEAHSLLLTVHFHPAVITSWQAEGLLHQFDHLVQQLRSVSQRSLLKVGELDFCSPHDIQVIKGWNEFEFDYVKETIPDLFIKAASKTPHATAISAWDGDFTYEAVHQHATSLARYMMSKGVRPETLVPCCMDKSAWTLISMLAVLLAGGTLIPFDPAHPPARHAEIVRKCQATIVLCSPKYQDRFRGLADTIHVDDHLFTVLLAQHAFDNTISLPQVKEHDAAFVIYTSGSTGTPKGVVLEHHSFCTSTKVIMERMKLTQSSRVFQFTSYAFDVAMGEIFGALTRGACLCVPSEEMRTGDLAQAMNALQVTWAFLTPSVANIIEPTSLTTVQILVCGGEALTPETISMWADKIVLMNGYGPAECTVFCVSNDNVSIQKDHTNIGRAMKGGHTWVVDPRDHNRLVPLGCVGELLIEGPIVARGYLNDEEKTREAFVEEPSWTSLFYREGDRQALRLYKTGDLVKYCPDGSLTFLGRKDHQVKLHGQRMELGEIEANLQADNRIRHALVSLPKSGRCQGRLVAIVSLHDFAPLDPSIAATDFVSISTSQMKTARTHVSNIQKALSETLPPYMVPSVWFVVEALPLLVSGKLNRAYAQSWVNNMDHQTYKNAVSAEQYEELSEPETPTGQILKKVWSSVLNTPMEKLPINQSFLSVGGDSITAMQVMTRCRDHSIRLSLQEVIRSRSITELAKLVDSEDRLKIENDVGTGEEQENHSFPLSPIQELYFDNSLNKEHGDRFNQSQLLLINRKVEVAEFKAAIDSLVQRHSTLRSRYSKTPAGSWAQTISPDVASSYKFQSWSIDRDSDLIQLIYLSQRSIDIISGPLVVVDLVERSDGSQIVSLIAHHLVVDVVSWFNIINDLELSLTSGSFHLPKPFSFQSWCTAQTQHAKSQEIRGEVVLPFKIEPANLDFWGMSESSNLYGDMARQSFVLTDANFVSLAMNHCHMSLRTEPLDLFISAILQSFGLTFEERQLPTLFNEGHGRESWDHSIDISQTVGWFTSLCPIQISMADNKNHVDSVSRVKDARRSVVGNGRPYFAHRYLTETGRREFKDHAPMEILVNYLGRTQQSNRNASLLEPFDYEKTTEEEKLVSDVGAETHRLALFEISISVTDEGISFVFMYNRRMLHQDRIADWVAKCSEVLTDTAKQLDGLAPTPTLHDVPLMPVSYAELQTLVGRSLPACHVNTFEEVEEIFPCSPMQTGILLSQLQDAGRYLIHTVVEVLPETEGTRIDAQKLSRACEQVVNRHAALRTIFINSVYRGGAFDQVVLKPRDARVSLIRCREIDVMAKLNMTSLERSNREPGPALPYQITICQTPQGKVFLKFEVNHAITDGASTSLIMQDIAKAYDDKLTLTTAPSYREYIKYISSVPLDSSLDFWSSYLREPRPTDFPTISYEFVAERDLGCFAVEFDRFAELQSICSAKEVTFSTVILATWALVLRNYANSDDVCFGYLASGRDASIPDIDQIVGPFINMLVFRCRFEPWMSLTSLLQNAQQDYLSSLPHQHFSLARVSHGLGVNGSLFNTAVSIQNAGSLEDSATSSIRYESLEAHDPSEYAVTVNANTTRHDEGITFRYWTDVLSSSQAMELSRLFSGILNLFIDHCDQEISQLGLLNKPHVVMSRKSGLKGTLAHDESLFSTESTKEAPYQAIEKRPKTSSDSGFSGSKPSEDDNFMPTLSATKKRNDPSGGREQLSDKLLSLWRETLGLGDCTISYQDSFFELGGDSIIAMSMVGNAKDEGMVLTVADVFKNPTFGDMLHCLASSSTDDSEVASSDDETAYSRRDAGVNEDEEYEPFSMLDEKDKERFIRFTICPMAGISRASIMDVLPTTDFQTLSISGSLLESRWMLNHFYLDGSGSLNIPLLRESITNVMASFDILRTVFVPYQERFLQVVLRQVQPQVSIHEDVEDIEQFTNELEKASREETPRFGESYVRFVVALERATCRHRIFLRISHAQYDGVCFPTILGALKACYDGEPLLPSPNFAKYVWGALGQITAAHYIHWKKLLKGARLTDVIRRKRSCLQTSPTKVLKRVVPIRSLASFNITTATIVKAAWSVVLTEITGESDVVFGHLISGRNVANVSEIGHIVGPCLNVVPVRVRQETSWTVHQLLRYIQDQQVNNMPYESLGFREIIEKCVDQGGDEGYRNFSTTVQHQSMPQTDNLTIGGIEYKVGVISSQEDETDFSVVTTPIDAANMEVCLIYAQDEAISPRLAEQMFESLCKAITNFSTSPDSVVGCS